MTLVDNVRRGLATLSRRGEADVSECPPPDELRNARLLRLEGVFASLMFGGVQAFYPLYAIRLGASNAVIGWLTAAPALIGLLWQVPCSRLLWRFKGFLTPLLIGMAFHRLFVMSLAGVVWLPAAWAPWGIVILVGLAAFPASLWGVTFQTSWVRMFSPSRLARVVGLRWSVASVSVTVSVFLLGKFLDLAPYPFNFQIMFVGIGLISLVSVYVILQFRFPPWQPPARPAVTTAPRQSLRSLWALAGRHREFTRLEATALLSYMAIYGAVPLFRIYWVRDLGANGAWLGALAAASSVGSAVGTWFWGRVSHPQRNRRHALIACLGVAVGYPLFTLLFHSLAPLLVVNLLAGFASGGNELMFLNRSMELSTREHLPTFVAIYSTTINLASFVAPLLSTALLDSLGMRPVLALVAELGLVGAGLVFRIGWGRSMAQHESAANA